MKLSKFVRYSLIIVAAVVGLAVAFPLVMAIPVGVTAKGNQIIVEDYVRAYTDDFLDRSGVLEKASAGTQDRIDGQLFSDLTPGVTTLSIMEAYLSEDELISSSYVGGIQSKSYVVRNSDGSTVSLIFHDGVLASKGQRGLK